MTQYSCSRCNDQREIDVNTCPDPHCGPIMQPCPECSPKGPVTITFWVVHHKDRGKDPRPYVWTRPPDEAQRASIEKDGYLIFRVEAALPGVADVGTFAPNSAREDSR